MKMPRSIILSLFIIPYAAHLTTRAAATEIFTLPEARAAEACHSDIEAALRDTYQLKI